MGHDYFEEPRSLFARREGDGCMKDSPTRISFGARGENLDEEVKKVGITYFSFVFTIFFSL
jgi:hypothetical protein